MNAHGFGREVARLLQIQRFCVVTKPLGNKNRTPFIAHITNSFQNNTVCPKITKYTWQVSLAPRFSPTKSELIWIFRKTTSTLTGFHRWQTTEKFNVALPKEENNKIIRIFLIWIVLYLIDVRLPKELQSVTFNFPHY